MMNVLLKCGGMAVVSALWISNAAAGEVGSPKAKSLEIRRMAGVTEDTLRRTSSVGSPKDIASRIYRVPGVGRDRIERGLVLGSPKAREVFGGMPWTRPNEGRSLALR